MIGPPRGKVVIYPARGTEQGRSFVLAPDVFGRDEAFGTVTVEHVTAGCELAGRVGA